MTGETGGAGALRARAARRARAPDIAPARRAARRILEAEARYLGYLRYLALHARGICATFLAIRHPGEPNLGDNLACATVPEFRRWGVLADANAGINGGPVFWTVVPDGVATVTLRFTDPNTHAQTTTTARPVNNVVVARRPHDALNQTPSTIVLRAGDGHVLKKVAVTPNMPTIGYPS